MSIYRSNDIGRFFFHQCKHSNIQLPYWASEWIDLKDAFQEIYNLRDTPSLPTMVEHFRMPFIGQWHSGHDDVLNIAAVLCRMLCKGYEFQPNQFICDKCRRMGP